MRRFYPAAPFGMQELVRRECESLENLGYENRGLWLKQVPCFTKAGGVTIKGQATWDACQSFSERDLVNVLEADTLIHWSPGTALERNTHIAELGIALGTGRQVICISPSDEELKEVIGCIFERFQKVPSSWEFHKIVELHRVKPVIRYDSFAQLLADIMNPEKVTTCLGCGCEYRKRDCGCPAGSGYIWKTKLTDLSVLPPKFPGSAALASIPVSSVTRG